MRNTEEVNKARSAIAVAVRQHKPDNEKEARRDLAAAKIAECIERAVAAAPPLTPEQIDRLSGLLRAGGGSSARQ